jgi:hypothetical protein
MFATLAVGLVHAMPTPSAAGRSRYLFAGTVFLGHEKTLHVRTDDFPTLIGLMQEMHSTERYPVDGFDTHLKVVLGGWNIVWVGGLFEELYLVLTK